ncbi:hypothetical protein M5K25_008473 [Dendrobium thyrsiflorum]|uniref:Protein MIZU-KUSSEI 1 n=1 Tax=Dendrobium thyrsiflorum TaxID=117978 RepID=A0ABD0V8J3_DENTH
MKTIMSRSPHESSFSFSRRHFQRIIAKVELAAGKRNAGNGDGDDDSIHLTPAFSKADPTPPRRRVGAVARIKSAFSHAVSMRAGRPGRNGGLGSRVIGTLFGPRRGHVRFAFQVDPRAGPAFLVELAMPTTSLVKEMASGLVRIALECERGGVNSGQKLVEELTWRAYCNGKKCGYAVRRECGATDWRVLRAVEPVSMGAGMLPPAPAKESGEGEGEIMYMRARFERVVGSKDSEAFYMMNPDGNGGPELSIYLLRA